MHTRLAQTFQALSDDTRLRIVNLIAGRGPELCVCDLVASLELPQSTVSRHLNILRRAGLLSPRRDGLWINYSLSEPERGRASFLLDFLRESWENEKIFQADLKRFDRLHAQNRIVRCARGQEALSGESAA